MLVLSCAQTDSARRGSVGNGNGTLPVRRAFVPPGVNRISNGGDPYDATELPPAQLSSPSVARFAANISSSAGSVPFPELPACKSNPFLFCLFCLDPRTLTMCRPLGQQVRRNEREGRFWSNSAPGSSAGPTIAGHPVFKTTTNNAVFVEPSLNLSFVRSRNLPAACRACTEEDRDLKAGVGAMGTKWSKILRTYHFNDR
eukprot:SAG31_NODE_1269_length_9066_cov_7.882792_4_plen_200_part_00